MKQRTVPHQLSASSTWPLDCLAFEDQRAFWTAAPCFTADEDGCMSIFKGVLTYQSLHCVRTENDWEEYLKSFLFLTGKLSLQLWLCNFCRWGRKSLKKDRWQACPCTLKLRLYWISIGSIAYWWDVLFLQQSSSCTCICLSAVPQHVHRVRFIMPLWRPGWKLEEIFDSTVPPVVWSVYTHKHQAPAVRSREDAAEGRKMFAPSIASTLTDAHIELL